MAISKTIAARLGPTPVATAVMALANLGATPPSSKSPMLIILAGYAAFVPGLAIVYSRNQWTGGWPAFVTLAGWLSLVIGQIRMVFHMPLTGITAKHGAAMTGVLHAIGVVFLLIGGVLSFKAYGMSERRVAQEEEYATRRTQI
jgi:hypothetical protein